MEIWVKMIENGLQTMSQWKADVELSNLKFKNQNLKAGK